MGAGQPVDAYVQPPPGPWDVPATPPSFFSDSKKVIKVPYTSSVKVNDQVMDGGQCGCICFLVLLMRKRVACRAATPVWEWDGGLAKTVPGLEM